MPARLDYDQAILFAETRLKVSNSDLRAGQVETVKMGATSLPWGNQGGFAVVYKFRSKSGSMRALRCFTRTVIDPDFKNRYERIGPYFRAHAAEITADFTYYDQGIEVLEMVNGQPQNTIYPIIDMEWIEGVTLFDYVEKLCKQRDQAKLGEIANRWFDVVLKLRKANAAHGDLAAVNVMVRNDGRLVLIDYDGVYIQEFQGKKQLLFGTLGFQHPQMQRRPFNEWMDEFSSQVIFTALLALQTQPTLWDTYVKYGPNGKPLDQTLLFTQKDFETPQQSSLFRDLERSPSAQVREAIKELKRACGQEVSAVRFPVSIGDPEYQKKQALEELKKAVAAADDEQIVQAWGIGLEYYQPAQQYRPMADRARMRVRALDTFRTALQSRSLQQILTSYDPGLLDPCKNVTQPDRDKLALAQQLDKALRADKDDLLLAAWQAIEQPQHAGFLTLNTQEQQRLDVAQCRKTLIETFRAALATHSIEQIVAAFDPALDTYPSISMEERQVLVRARAFHQACLDDDDVAIEDIADEIRGIHIFSKTLSFTATEEARIQLAIRRKEAVKTFKVALMTRRADKIVAGYDHTALDTCKSITGDERQKVALAEEWETARKLDRDERLLAAWEAIERCAYAGFLAFTQIEEDRIDLARRRKAALDQLRQALGNKNIQQICLAYPQMLHHHPDLTQEERAIITRAQHFYQACQEENDLAIEEAAREISDIHTFKRALLFTQDEERRVQTAIQRKDALMKFRLAVKNARAEQIEAAYDPYLLGPCKNMTQAERDQYEAAKRFNQMRQAVLAALLANNMKQADKDYDEDLAKQFTDFTPDEQKRIEAVRNWGQLERALDSGAYLLALRTAQTIEKATGKLISDVRLRMAKRRFILSLHPQNLQVSRMGSHIQVQWDWPASDLIPAVAIAWRLDRFPRDPSDVPAETRHLNPHHCYRNNNATQQGAYTIDVGYATTVYIQVFSAIPDWDQVRREQLWYYSDGQEETSRSAVGLSA